MVQRLSLMGILSPEERTMGVRSLEAISGMQPRPFEITKEIWEPKYRYKPQPSGQPAQIEQYRLFVVKTADSISIEADEVPEAGRNIKVISQTVLCSNVLSDAQDVPKFLSDLGYEYKSAYVLNGMEFVLHDHVVVHMFKLMNTEGELLDKSQQNLVHASIDVESVTDLNSVEQATQLLLSTQQELRGIVALKAPNRGSFNTRMPRVVS